MVLYSTLLYSTILYCSIRVSMEEACAASKSSDGRGEGQAGLGLNPPGAMQLPEEAHLLATISRGEEWLLSARKVLQVRPLGDRGWRSRGWEIEAEAGRVWEWLFLTEYLLSCTEEADNDKWCLPFFLASSLTSLSMYLSLPLC